MTTSSDSRTPSAPRPDGEHYGRHWRELTAALPPTVATLDAWFDEQLDELERRNATFITHRSLRKDLRG